jgi:hypothetical protein
MLMQIFYSEKQLNMEPFLKAFYTLKTIISNPLVEVVLDDFGVEEDPFNTDLIAELSAEGSYLVERRYDIRVNGIYHSVFVSDLVAAFKEFNEEIKDNFKRSSLISSIPSYLEKLTEELTLWSDNITEYETKLNSRTKWLYLYKDIDKGFLKSEGLSDSIIENISSIFLCLKYNIIETLESIKKFENPNYSEKGIDVPEDIFSNVTTPLNTTGVLDIYQTALLFYYLKKHKEIIPVSYTSLSRLVAALTGHSFQNIRTDKGYGAIAYILSDKSKNQNFKDSPNYNLIILKDFLQNIIDDIEVQINKNHPA